MARSEIDAAVDYLKQRGWEFRPAERINGVFKPIGKYDLSLFEDLFYLLKPIFDY